MNDQIKVAMNDAAAAQLNYENMALAVQEQQATPKELDSALKALNAAEQTLNALKAAQIASQVRDTRNAEEQARADAAAHRQRINEASKAIRAIAQEYDAAVDHLVTIGKQFEQARQQLYAADPGAGVIRAIETGLMEIPAGLAFKLSALVGRNASPAFYSYEQSCLLSFMPSVA